MEAIADASAMLLSALKSVFMKDAHQEKGKLECTTQHTHPYGSG
jgi:hypothetical protein